MVSAKKVENLAREMTYGGGGGVDDDDDDDDDVFHQEMPPTKRCQC
jgi:hypothetical protein